MTSVTTGIALFVLGSIGFLVAAPGASAPWSLGALLLGVVLALVTPSVYFTHLENLEPRAYRHEAPIVED